MTATTTELAQTQPVTPKTDPASFLFAGLEGIDPESEEAAEILLRNSMAFCELADNALPFDEWIQYQVWTFVMSGRPVDRFFEDLADGYYQWVWRPQMRLRARTERWLLPERMPQGWPEALWLAIHESENDREFRRRNLVVRTRPESEGVTIKQAQAEITILGMVLCHDDRAMDLVRSEGVDWHLCGTEEAAQWFIGWWDSMPPDERPFLVNRDEIRDVLMTGGVLTEWLDNHLNRVIQDGADRLLARIEKRRATRKKQGEGAGAWQ